ncbi:Or9e95CTE, partial [Eciton burchellii]
MISLMSRYFNLNRILLLMIGLWPYKQSKLIRLQLILFFFILISFIVVQLMTFATSKINMELIIEVCPAAFFFIAYVIKYSSFYFNIDVVKHLLDILQYTYIELEDESEIAIIERHWNIARRYTEILTMLGIISMSIFFSLPILPRIVDVSWPTNESRRYSSLQIWTEYFIDQERYFYLLILHMYAAVYVGATAMLSTGAMLIIYAQHVCGMFKVASYRMKQVMRNNAFQANNTGKENLIYTRIVSAVDMHRKAMKFIELFLSTFNIFFFFLIPAGQISLTFSLFQIFHGVSSGYNIIRLMSPSMYAIIFYTYMFLANNIAQEITDYNNYVFATVYNVKWYIAPLRMQKLILFLLQRGTKVFNMVVGGLFVASL